ncbi:MAG TPA: ATP-binding protein [Campylobacterales bacterium]|nr:ATP-binding protein [Campylobacterales bacterium]HHS92614.1 ATP-binding protein [Campylobacterales bacterium]
MQLLEYFYDRNNELENYHPRKFTIAETTHLLLYGSPASGKTSLALDYLNTFDEELTLYIDFLDPKFTFYDIIEEDVESFILDNEIEILVLDHYEMNYFENLPKVKQVIIVSREYHDMGNYFESLKLPLLDYEEFFSFQQRGNETQLFNQFLRLGTFPALATHTLRKEQYFLSFLQSHFDDSELKLLNILAHFNTTSVTTHQLYTYAKERYKISKDLIYKQINAFEKQGIIYYVSDFQNKKQKKLIFFDFALVKYLSFSQNFPRVFETMIALSLIKHEVSFQFFGLHGYITQQRHLIYPAPFETEERVWKKAHNLFSGYKKAKVTKVYIITVNLRYEFKIETILFEALPFYEWVVINDDL